MQVKNTFGCKFLSVFLCLSMLLSPIVTLAEEIIPTVEKEKASSPMTVNDAVTVREEVTLTTPIFRLVEDVDEITGDKTYAFVNSGTVGDTPDILKYSSNSLSSATAADGIYKVPVDIKSGNTLLPAGTYVAAPTAESAYEWYVSNNRPAYIIQGDDLKKTSWITGGSITVADNKSYATFKKTNTSYQPNMLRADFKFYFEDMGITEEDSYILVKYRTTSTWTGGYTFAPVCCNKDQKNFSIVSDGSWHDHIFDASTNAHWASGEKGDAGIVSFTAQNTTGVSQDSSYDLAYIAFFGSEAEAKLYAENNPVPDKLYSGAEQLATALKEENRVDKEDHGAFVRYTVNSSYSKDPYIHLNPPSDLPVPTGDVKSYMSIKYRTTATATTTAVMIFSYKYGSFPAQQVGWNWVRDGNWNTITIDVTTARTRAAEDIANGSEAWLRFDMFDDGSVDKTGSYIDVAYIAFFNSENTSQADNYSNSVVVPEKIYAGDDLTTTNNDSLARVKFTVENNYVTYQTKTIDPYAHLETCEEMPLDKSIMAIKYRTSSFNATAGRLYFGGNSFPSVTWDWNNNGEWNVVIVDTKSKRSHPDSINSPWFRFDVVDNLSGTGLNGGQIVDIAYIAFFGTKAEAVAYSKESPYTIESASTPDKYIASGPSISSSDIGCVIPNDNATCQIFSTSTGDKATLAYDGKTLYMYEKVADANFTVPAVKAWLADDTGTVAIGAAGAPTGAYIKVWAGDNVHDIPITTDMLYTADGTQVNVSTEGTFKNLLVKYEGVYVNEKVTTDKEGNEVKTNIAPFTLTVIKPVTIIQNNGANTFKLVDPIDPNGNVIETLKPNTDYMLLDSSDEGYAKAISLRYLMDPGKTCEVVSRSVYVRGIEINGEKQYYVQSTRPDGKRDTWTTVPITNEIPAGGYNYQLHPHIGELNGFTGPFYNLKSTSDTYLNYTGEGSATASVQGVNPGFLPLKSTLFASDDKNASGSIWFEMPETTVKTYTKVNVNAGTNTTDYVNTNIGKGTGLACFGTTREVIGGGENGTGILSGDTYLEWRGLHYSNEINNFTTRNVSDNYILSNANMTPYSRVFYFEKDTSISSVTAHLTTTDVAVGYGAAGADITGAEIVLTIKNDDGTYSTQNIPVTMDMLSTDEAGKTAVSTTSSPNANKEFNNVYVTYQDKTIGMFEKFCVAAKSTADPAYPNPGSVVITKELDMSTHNYNETATARLELSVTGVPVSSGADVVIAIDNSGSMDTVKIDGKTRRDLAKEALTNALKIFQNSGKDVSVSVVTFDGYDLIDAGYVLNRSRYVVKNGVLDKTKYRVDTNCDSNLEADTAQFLTSGFNALIPELDDRFVDAEDLTNKKIEMIVGNYIDTGAGTNYDRGLELAYETLNARQKQNALNGVKRDSYLILMGDGDSLQYNYLGISGHSGNEEDGGDARKNQAMLKGELDDGGTYNGGSLIKDLYNTAAYLSDSYYNHNHTDLEFTSSSLPTHPYYDTHYNKYGASWMAEAIKGSVDKKYMVIDPDANPYDEYLTYVNGLGATVYTIGFGVIADSDMSNVSDCKTDKVASKHATAEVLRKISSDFSLEYAEKVQSNGKIVVESSMIYTDEQYSHFTITDINSMFTTIASKIVVATDAIFTDTLSNNVDLRTSKVALDAETGNYELPVSPCITVKKFETYKYSEIDTVVDGVYVSTDLVGKIKKGCEAGKVVENVVFGDTITSTVKGNLTIADNKLVASTFTYYTDTKTFKWNVGDVPEDKYVMSFDIYLDKRENGSYVTNADGDTMATTAAYLDYVNIENEARRINVKTPSLPWGGGQVGYGFYLVDSNGNPITTIKGNPVSFELSNKVKDAELYTNFNNGEVSEIKVASLPIPDGYKIYDTSAVYKVLSNQDGTGYWNIDKTANNGKVDSTYVTQFSSGGITSSNATNESSNQYSYANTIVWFALEYVTPSVGETIVIDYGLPVEINVLADDNMSYYIEKPAIAITEGTLIKDSNLGTVEDNPFVLCDKFYTDAEKTIYKTSATGIFGEAVLNSEAGIVTYTPDGDSMIRDDIDIFTYVLQRNESHDELEKYNYQELTIVPATSIYYEDSFVTFESFATEYAEDDTNKSNPNKKPFSEYGDNLPDGYSQYKWEDVGTAADKNQGQDRPGPADEVIQNDLDNVYGYDGAYADSVTYSLGGAKKITVDGGFFGEATFTFKGTGFDIISLTSNTTGAIVVVVTPFDEDGNLNTDAEKNYLVDTYYGYSYSQNKETGDWEWTPTANVNAALYQVPVIKVDDLDYNKYQVTVIVSCISIIDKTTDPGYEFYFDAVRIHDPAGIYSGDEKPNDYIIEDAYKDDNEAWPEYTELRDIIIEANTIKSSVNKDGSSFVGSMFIDGCPIIKNTDSGNYDNGSPAGTQQWVNYKYFAGRYEYERKEGVAPAISDYINYGPNNETYLSEGQAIAFSIASDEKLENLASVQVGIKAAKGAPKVNIYGVQTDSEGKITIVEELNASGETINNEMFKSATELYYDISALKGMTVVIMNAGDGSDDNSSILSITNIKKTHKTEPTEKTSADNVNAVYIDAVTVELAMASLATVEVPAFEPETFDASVSSSTVEEGKIVTVTVKTSSDVDYITVNGEVVTKYRRALFSRQRTWTFKVEAAEVGEMPIEIVAYSDENIASVPTVMTVNVTGTQSGSSSSNWLDRWFGGWFR